jgi:hypothetical protein
VDDACDELGYLGFGSPLGFADTIFHGTVRNSAVGHSVAHGDFNGDGNTDLVIGAFGDRTNGGRAGAVYVFEGPLDPAGDIDVSTADRILVGPGAGYRAGFQVVNAGDVDGDGTDDLLIGSDVDVAAVDPGDTGGVAWLVYGGPVGGVLDLADADVTFRGVPGAGEAFGNSLAGVADVTGDGNPDILIGAPSADPLDRNEGRIYVFSNVGFGDVDADSADAVIEGTTRNALFGTTLGGTGDVNGDGVADFAIGAPKDTTSGNRAGAAYYFYGGVGISGTLSADDADSIFRGRTFDRVGGAIGDIGDLNGDGIEDMSFGAKQWGSVKRGAVYVVYGSPTPYGSVRAEDIYDHRIRGSNANDLMGSSIAGRQDFDNDGNPDLLLGAEFADGPSDDATGAAWALHGPFPTDIVVLDDGPHWAQHRSAFGGHSVSTIPDLNGDGFDEIFVGSWQSTHLGVRRPGLAALFYGGEDTIDEIAWYRDTDGDGWGDPGTETFACEQPGPDFVELTGDCNDGDNSIFPFADELDCGSPIDRNCDGVTGAVDTDGDGVLACAGDCDDTDTEVATGLDEICGDGKDNDCENGIDDSFSVDALPWYPDVDLDGYGAQALEIIACEEPVEIFTQGSINVGGDCDDGNVDINPDAAEVCDTVDNDCDSIIDEDDAVDAPPWYGDADGDLYGDRFDQTFACNQPAGYVGNFEDCDDTDADVAPGATEVSDFVDNDCSGQFYLGGPVSTSEYILRLTGEDAFGQLGDEVVFVPDVNGDGIDEIAVGAPFSNASGADEGGIVYLRYGAADGGDFDLAEIRQDGSRRYDVRFIPTPRARGLFGAAMASGDVNGDGIGDIVIGAFRQARPSTQQGAVFLYLGPFDEELGEEDADAIWTGADAGSQLGEDVSVADIDGDGFDDIIMGANAESAGGTRRGAAHIV